MSEQPGEVKEYLIIIIFLLVVVVAIGAIVAYSGYSKTLLFKEYNRPPLPGGFQPNGKITPLTQAEIDSRKARLT